MVVSHETVAIVVVRRHIVEERNDISQIAVLLEVVFSERLRAEVTDERHSELRVLILLNGHGERVDA